MFSASELELVGAIIGDGHIHKSSKYYVGFTGNKLTDKEYFAKLGALIESVWKKKARIFESSGGLRIRLYSKDLVHRLITVFSLPFNSGKCYVVKIPKGVALDYSQAKHVLRGLVDTDGSVFVSKKPGVECYPSLEITTVSSVLAEQVREILLCAGFRVTNLRRHKSKLSTVVCYKICLYGKNNLKKWLGEIGFSNPVKLAKAQAALAHPF